MDAAPHNLEEADRCAYCLNHQAIYLHTRHREDLKSHYTLMALYVVVFSVIPTNMIRVYVVRTLRLCTHWQLNCCRYL
jgi:hypothetical protein